MSRRVSKAEQFKADMERCRGMGWVELGMMVEVDGHLGTIKGMNGSANLDVEFTNQLKWGKGTHNCHPTWETRYFDAEGKVIRDYTKAGKAAAAAEAGAKAIRDDLQALEQARLDALDAPPPTHFAGLPPGLNRRSGE